MGVKRAFIQGPLKVLPKPIMYSSRANQYDGNNTLEFGDLGPSILPSEASDIFRYSRSLVADRVGKE